VTAKYNSPMNVTCALVIPFLLLPAAAHAQTSLFAKDNLVAWCIVPFDAKNRSPEDRAAMLDKLGLHKFAYDWRTEHLPAFERELAALAKHRIELTAIWLPAPLNKETQFLLDTVKKHNLHPQLWVMANVTPQATQEKSLDQAIAQLKPIARQAADLKCQVALYNHGGWFGEPENQIAIIHRLKQQDGLANVGIVYNLHHGHEHLARFSELLAKMKPHLLCLNLNGMIKEGDKSGKKILPIGEGDQDLLLLKIIQQSGYTGPIGILNHTDQDAETRLRQNLDGLASLAAKLKD
jgi:hypothetical protein